VIIEPGYAKACELPGKYGDKQHEINYKICNAIDPLKLHGVLKALLAEGMHENLAVIFEAQAEGLLAAIRTENNRLQLNKARNRS